MQSSHRITSRILRARLIVPRATPHPYLARFAHSSYGNEQSGHQQGHNETNPKAHLEHPGPEPPDTKSNTSTGAPSSSSSKDSSMKVGGGTQDSSSQGGSPKISRPESAAEENDPEVRKHNEEMAQRSDRTTNQLSEEDNKVDKQFWKGDVGSPDNVKK